MTLSQMMSIIRARFKLITLVTLLSILFGIIITIVVPPKFKATNTIIFNHKYTDPISGQQIPAQLVPGYMATEVDIISSKATALEVVDKLKLYENEGYINSFKERAKGVGELRDYIAEKLIEDLAVKPARTSNLIEITAKADSREFVADVANTFSESYIRKSTELKVGPARKAAAFYKKQVEELKAKVDLANEKYSNFQRENNIQTEGVDAETARLNDLSNQLVNAQAQAAESRSRKVAANRGGSPDVASDSVVQIHKATLASAQAEFAKVSSQYAANHPEYIAAQSQVSQARAALNRQISAVSQSVNSTANIYARSAAELKRAVAAQRVKVLNTNKLRNELNLLASDLKNAQAEYDTANERYIKSNFEGESDQSNITLLTAAVPPIWPYFPNKKIIYAASAFLGMFLSISYVLMRELSDRRVRSVEDLDSLVDFPIFGVLPKTELKQLSSRQVKALAYKE